MLEKLFHELNTKHFAGQLPLPELTWNSRLSSSAGRFTARKKGILSARLAQIEIASYLLELDPKHIRDTLLHEMIHYSLWFQKKPYGHTPEFYQIMRRLGATRYNTVPKLRPVKYWYECANCKVRVPARKKLQLSACAICCKKWNQGKFTVKFILTIIKQATPEYDVAEITEEQYLTKKETWDRLEKIKRAISETRTKWGRT